MEGWAGSETWSRGPDVFHSSRIALIDSQSELIMGLVAWFVLGKPRGLLGTVLDVKCKEQDRINGVGTGGFHRILESSVVDPVARWLWVVDC
jgi:hypothetical protein